MNSVSSSTVLIFVLVFAGLGAWHWGVQAQGTEAVPRFLPVSGETVVAERPSAEAFGGYDYGKPTRSFALPPDLTELSALTEIDGHTVAGVQDEKGIVFLIDVRTGRVTHRVPFGERGDYEGLTRVGATLWVLRSDGWLAEIAQEGARFAIRREFDLQLPHQDYEGLGYDPQRKRLLVAPKDRPKGSKEDRARRRVYLFDPRTGETESTFALDTTLHRIRGDALVRGLDLPERTTKKGKTKTDLKLNFSSIALHPITGHLYALSATDDALFAFDLEGHLADSYLFRGPGMQQLEGMTFLPSGDLVIASEGVEGPSQLHVFAVRTHASKGRK